MSTILNTTLSLSEDNLLNVSLRDRTSGELIAQKTAKSFMEYLSGRLVPANFILPKGTRFHTSMGKHHWIVIELFPDTHLIKTDRMTRGLKVAMPFQYFVFTVNKIPPNSYGVEWSISPEIKIFWSPRRLRRLNDPVIVAKVPNVGESGNICFGNTFPDSSLPVDTRIEVVIKEFYSTNSNFNEDLGFHLPSKYGTFREWAKDSHDDPYCWKKWDEFRYYTEGISIREFAGIPEESRSTGDNLWLEIYNAMVRNDNEW